MTPYEKLRLEVRESLTAGISLAEETPHHLPPELELQALWFAGAFGREFSTQNGQKVRIIQFGEWNRSSGPDFLHASIELDGTQHSGPLELDTHQVDWEQHQHATNPEFRDVILHVTFQAGPRTHFSRSDIGREIPCVVLSLEAIAPALRHTPLNSALSHPGRCSTPLAELPPERIHDLLQEAARYRLQKKSIQLQRLEESHGYEEALWQSLTRALGYGPNKLAMQLLGQRVQRRQLRELDSDLSREALLFGVAGFLSPKLHEEAPEDSRRYLESLWDEWWKIRPDYEPHPDRAIAWQLHGIRPTNHPQRRMGTLTALSQQWSKICVPAREPSAKKLKTLSERLVDLQHPFWSQHYTLRSKATTKPLSLLGKNRANEFIANYSYPRWFHQNQEAAWSEFCKLTSGPTSDPVRRAATRLFGQRADQDQFLKKIWHHQALLQIYHDFCLADTSACEDCPFPEQLSSW